VHAELEWEVLLILWVSQGPSTSDVFCGLEARSRSGSWSQSRGSIWPLVLQEGVENFGLLGWVLPTLGPPVIGKGRMVHCDMQAMAWGG
jgi:hypothetical protein